MCSFPNTCLRQPRRRDGETINYRRMYVSTLVIDWDQLKDQTTWRTDSMIHVVVKSTVQVMCCCAVVHAESWCFVNAFQHPWLPNKDLFVPNVYSTGESTRFPLPASAAKPVQITRGRCSVFILISVIYSPQGSDGFRKSVSRLRIQEHSRGNGVSHSPATVALRNTPKARLQLIV